MEVEREKEMRTVFVGNIPVDATAKDFKKRLRAILGDGTVESIRFRHRAASFSIRERASQRFSQMGGLEQELHPTFVYNLSVPRTSVSVQLHLYVLIQIQKDTFSLLMHILFQLRSFTSSCPSGAFFRYSHFWLLYGFRIGSDRIGIY